MPDCQSNNGPVATATPSRANKAGNIVVAGGRTRQKQTTKTNKNTSVGENKPLSKPCSLWCLDQSLGKQKAWEKMPGRNSLKPTHTSSSSSSSVVVVEAGPAGILHKKNGRDTHHVACLQLRRRSNSHEGLPVVNTAPQNPHRLSAATTRVPWRRIQLKFLSQRLRPLVYRNSAWICSSSNLQIQTFIFPGDADTKMSPFTDPNEPLRYFNNGERHDELVQTWQTTD